MSDSLWTGRPKARAEGSGVYLEVSTHCCGEDLTKAEALELAAELIVAATGYEPVREDGEYLSERGAPNPHYRVMRLVSVDHTAACLSPADRETYLRSVGR